MGNSKSRSPVAPAGHFDSGSGSGLRIFRSKGLVYMTGLRNHSMLGTQQLAWIGLVLAVAATGVSSAAPVKGKSKVRSRVASHVAVARSRLLPSAAGLQADVATKAASQLQ